jgi:hypothetical protein
MRYIPLVLIALVLLLDPLRWYTSKKRQRRETSGRMWMRTIIVIGLIAVVWWGLFMPWVNKNWVSDIEVINPDGEATALVAYYPGRSGFQEEIATAFTEGLVANGWRVEMTTVSTETPTDLGKYGLVVVGSPTYMLAPSPRVQNYLKSADFGGAQTVIMSSGLVASGSALAQMETLVEASGGRVIDQLDLKTGSGMEGMTNPDELARDAAQAIPLP